MEFGNEEKMPVPFCRCFLTGRSSSKLTISQNLQIVTVMKIFAAFAACALVAAATMESSALGATITIQNPSFESPVLAPGVFTAYDGTPNLITDWTNPGFSGAQHMTSAEYTSGIDGVNAAYNDTSGSISQNLTSTLGAGDYTLTVAVGWRNGHSFNGGSFGLYTSTGTPLDVVSVTQPALQGTFVDEMFTFNSVGNVNLGDILRIQLNGNGGQSADFDNVRLDFEAAAVPEPSTYAMLLAGLGALFLIGRRRRQRSH
jgi:hypothetical protein